MNGDKCFFDTNVVVYTVDFDLPEKQSRAYSLLQTALAHHQAAVSYQVVQEYLNTVTRKFKTPGKLPDALHYAQAVLWPVCAVLPSQALFERGCEIHTRTRYSFYDSLIIAAALEARCKTLYSEDLQHGQRIESLSIHNPFVETARKPGKKSRAGHAPT